MSEPTQILVYTADGAFDLADYPWLEQAVVHLKGGEGAGPQRPGQPGWVVLELYDHRDHPHPHPHTTPQIKDTP
jgi:hypothetical protein